MKISTSVIALAIAGLFAAVPASAQYMPTRGADADPANKTEASRLAKQKKEEEAQSTAAKSTDGRKLKISAKAQAAIVELQNAINANDTAAIPAKLAAAQSVAKSPDEKYFVAVNQVKAATNAKDLAGLRTGLEAMEASGAAETPVLVGLYTNLGIMHYEAKQVDQAAWAFERAVALDANNANSLKLLGSVREKQGRKAEALPLLQKSFALAKAAGQPPRENDYKFAAKLAYDIKSPAAGEITRAWIADYPTSHNWRDALRIYRDVSNVSADVKIDTLRLARAAGALKGELDYYGLATELFNKGNLAEAKAVVDEGTAANVISLGKPEFKDLATRLAKAPTRAAVDASAKAALAGGSAKAMLDAGDALYGVGAYAEAVPLYRAALAKGGLDANLVNLRLGAALARSGDKAGATAAFNAAGGAQAELAKYWQVWLAARG